MAASATPRADARSSILPAGLAKRGAALAKRAVLVVTCLYGIGCLAAWLLLSVGVDQGVLGTLLGFGPRWFLAVPLAVLVPTAAIWRWRSLWVLGMAGLVVMGPVMGFAVPWRGWVQSRGSGESIRIVSCNVGGIQDLSRLWGLVDSVEADVVAIQECPLDVKIPESGVAWHIARRDRLLIASRYPIVESSYRNSPVDQWRDPALLCDLETPAGLVHLWNLHLMTPRSGIDAVIHERLAGVPELQGVNELRRVETEHVHRQMAEIRGPTIVMGDFNMPAESRIYRDCFGQYANAFSTSGWGFGWSKFTRWHGVRIDHVLYDDSFRVSRCYVGLDVGSDHSPVVAELKLSN